MSIEIYPKESAARAEPNAKILLDHFQAAQDKLSLKDAIVFYNFPLFREDEQLLVADLVLVSPLHGVLLLSTVGASESDEKSRDEISSRLEGTFSQVFSRLVRYPRLRAGRTSLSFPVEAFVWAQEGSAHAVIKIGLSAIDNYLSETLKQSTKPIPNDVFDELVSVLDGSKALIKPRERKTQGFNPSSRVAMIAALEEEIRRFDRDQRVAYMTEVGGPQRIRGLAGSGKTVVLALKAAMTAIRNPTAKIAVTFYTKSLYQHIKQLITRFYRMHEDRDPDWNQVKILHAWGGATVDGLYYLAAKRFGHEPASFGVAQAASPKQPFGWACNRLLETSVVSPIYDYVFVDEAQDFPPEFMRLALALAVEEKLVIAYDVMQTIFDVEIPTAATLFGTDARNEPAISFEEDIILRKCYRNPREILVCAHAIGFGIYSKKIIQMLESREHWEDFGYEVSSGSFGPGIQVEITRPEENSPSSISRSNTIDQLICVRDFASAAEEAEYVAHKIQNDITVEGVPPEDILVICADDQNTNAYFRRIKSTLAALGISVNNLQDDTYSVRDFQREHCITLSTIYKAKGNEAFVVYVIGVDALFSDSSPRKRNRAFTAMTRARGWLTMTGIGPATRMLALEIQTAKQNFPALKFTYPSAEELVLMKRDLIKIPVEEADEALERLADDMEPDELEYLLKRKLRELQGKKRPKKKLG